jgi:hypothetical protein
VTLAGSEVWLELDLESYFPVDLAFDDIAISLTHSPLPVGSTGSEARYITVEIYEVDGE